MGEANTGERFLPEENDREMYIEHYQRYRFARRLVQNKVVLDAACGEGYGSSLLAEAASMVIGLDIDGETVAKANQKYGNEKVVYREGSVEKLPFEDHYFDIVVSFETIEHVDEAIQRKFLAEIKRVLRPDGILIMSTPNKAVYTDMVHGQNPFHIKEFYENEFIDFLKNHFKEINVLCQYPETGYFLVPEAQRGAIEYKGKERKDSRYIVAICSDHSIAYDSNTQDITCFDDSMYYFLYLYAHDKEQEVIAVKQEADLFEANQEREIEKQKEYIEHLEGDIAKQKEYIGHLEGDIEEQRQQFKEEERRLGEYIHYLEGRLLKNRIKKLFGRY